ncbi:MAG: hypothetical protein K2Y37_26065 [Pirellulales bacterium]|nr:hypothetical protein [Pirellulales bacterium]
MIGAAPPTPEQLAADLLDAALVRVAELSSVVARIQVELPDLDSVAGLSEAGVPRPHRTAPQLRGTIDGPFCEHASTLTAAVALRQIGPRPGNATELATIACEAAIPDPCFWTPQLPHRYRLKLELACGNDVLARHERWLGLRPLSVRERGFWFDGAGWVLRATDRSLVPGVELSHWREAHLAMLVRSPDDALCEAASQFGVLLVADIAGTSQQIVEQLQRLSRHAAVGLAIVDPSESLDFDVRRAAGGIILIQRVGKTSGATAGLSSSAFPQVSSVRPQALPSGATGSAGAIPLYESQPWPQALLVDACDPDQFANLAATSSLPLLVECTTEACASTAAARSACDTLQADTAGRGHIAGFLVRAAVDSSKH